MARSQHGRTPRKVSPAVWMLLAALAPVAGAVLVGFYAAIRSGVL